MRAAAVGCAAAVKSSTTTKPAADEGASRLCLRRGKNRRSTYWSRVHHRWAASCEASALSCHCRNGPTGKRAHRRTETALPARGHTPRTWAGACDRSLGAKAHIASACSPCSTGRKACLLSEHGRLRRTDGLTHPGTETALPARDRSSRT